MTRVEVNRTVDGATHDDGHDTWPQDAEVEPLAERTRAFTRSALRDVVYCGAVLVWSIVSFAVLVAGVAVTASLLLLVVGVFVWIGFVYVIRWTTAVDRRLASWQRHQRVVAGYREPTGRGFIPYLKALSSDPRTWKNMGWLGVTSIVGFVLGFAVILSAGLAVMYVTMPLWYWAVSHPHTEYGVTSLGLLTVTSLGNAMITAAFGLALIPCVLLLARGCAGLHAGLAARMLGDKGSA